MNDLTLQAAFGYSLLIGGPVTLLWFVLRGMFPRKVSDPYAQPHGWEERL